MESTTHLNPSSRKSPIADAGSRPSSVRDLNRDCSSIKEIIPVVRGKNPSPFKQYIISKHCNLWPNIVSLLPLVPFELIAASSFPVLAGEVNFRVDNPHVSGESVVAREGLLFHTESTSRLHFSRVVNGILMSGQVVRSREDRVARLSSGRVDAIAFVRPCLTVTSKQLGQRHPTTHSRCCLRDLRCMSAGRLILSMTFTLVLLQLLRTLEAQSASVIRASVCARIREC